MPARLNISFRLPKSGCPLKQSVPFQHLRRRATRFLPIASSQSGVAGLPKRPDTCKAWRRQVNPMTGNTSDTLPRTRRAPKGEKRREELLDAALQLFSLEGYTGASIARIADIVGISVAGVLHHFPNKVALLMGVLARRDEVNHKVISSLHSEPTLQGFVSGLRQINRSNATAPGVIRAFSMLNAESLVDSHPGWEWFQSRYVTIHGRMRARLDHLVVTGEVRRDVDLDAIVHQILAMMDGLQLQWLRFPETVDLVQRFDSYMAQVERDIRA
jgi:AcrR family transcriptional regulator